MPTSLAPSAQAIHDEDGLNRNGRSYAFDPLAFFGGVLMISGVLIQIVGMDPDTTIAQLAFAISWTMVGCTMFVSGVLLGIAEGRHERDRQITELR